ncbi:hypothetical protein Clacol_000247 [Clathrus columnatus]|uniref:Cytosolic Fe-S cluster assembly factor NAR1 n=1 Tax=Clathrus columnatus TaxID=1419009 RepID=A0AAV4ZWD7_9AGAM|nr:hypothetical protein Clacol_000247 [Clathrus columnatus]
MTFSGALTLSDLNDFITPSQACIKPVEVEVAADEPGAAATQINIDSVGNYYEVPAKDAQRPARKLKTAKISLNDCLACSGCITSAESVLITMQSHEEVLSFLSNNPPPGSPEHRIPVLSISPQSLASLSASISSTSAQPVSMRAILRRVQAFCRQALGFSHAFDTTFARHLALLEQYREFKEWKEETSTRDKNKFPMLASACPGWICYAEKTHAEMLPFISKTKSPQQIMGLLVKEWMGKLWNQTPAEIYHVTVMPCYDKKLEASRLDFYNDVYKTRHVDCVITTGELDLLMQEKGWDLSVKVSGEDAPDLANTIDGIPFPELVFHAGTSSGSYLHSIISFITTYQENQGNTVRLNSKIIRSSDYEEFTLEDTVTGGVIFKGAKCYGFRNLQNVVRKVGKESGVHGLPGGAVRARARKTPAEGQGRSSQDKTHDFIEVMACPSGCVNGGGQIRPSSTRKVLEEVQLDPEGYPRQSSNITGGDDDNNTSLVQSSANWGDKNWIKRVETSYWTSKNEGIDPTVRMTLLRVLHDICLPLESQPYSEIDIDNTFWMRKLDSKAESRRSEFFRTSYRKVESEVVGLAVKW